MPVHLLAQPAQRRRELAASEFVVVQAPSDTTGKTVAIVPTKALEQLSSYMVVITDDVKDAAGNDATPDQTYFLTQRSSPLISPAGAFANPTTCPSVAQSTDPLLAVASACSLEPLRLITNSHEAAAVSQGSSFWYDLLKKVASPSKSSSSGSQDPKG